jgi:hypothetical protein
MRFERTAYNLAELITKHVKSTHLDKLLKTGVVDDPVKMRASRQQMTHNSLFDKEDILFVDVSIFFDFAC